MCDNLLKKEMKGPQEGNGINDDVWRRGRGHRDENDEVLCGNDVTYRLRNESFRGTADAGCLGSKGEQSRLRTGHMLKRDSEHICRRMSRAGTRERPRGGLWTS